MMLYRLITPLRRRRLQMHIHLRRRLLQQGKTLNSLAQVSLTN
jgi:hypothetical protein